jgi:type I restriction enzyme S subunit
MTAEWRTLSLRQANVSLIDCEHRTPPGSDSGYPYIAIPQIRHGRIDLAGVRRITSEHFIEWTRKAAPQPYDVVLSRRCNPGETALIPTGLECALGQNLVLLRADGTQVYPPFLRWLVRGTDWWDQVGTFINVGAVFDSLRCADVPSFRLRIPPLPEQRGIAHILGALDDKIELNRLMSETLEAMARAVFKSWFVDFDPVRAKVAGRAPALPKRCADLFPARLLESDLGEIPAGWTVGPLLRQARLLSGGTPRTERSEYWH